MLSATAREVMRGILAEHDRTTNGALEACREAARLAADPAADEQALRRALLGTAEGVEYYLRRARLHFRSLGAAADGDMAALERLQRRIDGIKEL